MGNGNGNIPQGESVDWSKLNLDSASETNAVTIANQDRLAETKTDEFLHNQPFRPVAIDKQTQEEMKDKAFTPDETFRAWQPGQEEWRSSLIADRQKTGEAAWRAVEGGIFKGAMSILENVGYMADIEQWTGMSNDFDEGYTNWLSEWAIEMKSSYDASNPIYSEGTGDFGWWMQGSQSIIDSALGFAVPGGVAGKVIGRAFKVANQMMKFGKIAEVGATRLVTAIATNYAESQMMARELYENTYNEALANGVSHDEASRVAAQQGEDFIWQNKVNIVTDAVALGSLSKGKGIVNGMAQKTKRDIVLGIGRQMGSESLEELSSGFIQSDNERDALLELGLKSDDNKDYFQRALEYAQSDQGFTEAFFGALGGPAQSGGTNITTTLANKVSDRMGWNNRPTDPGVFSEAEPVAPEGTRPEAPINPGTFEDHLREIYPDKSEDWIRNQSKVMTSERNAHTVRENDFQKKKKAFDVANSPWAEYDNAMLEYKKKADEHQNKINQYNEDLEAFETWKNTGRTQQTISEVKNFLENEADLIKEYNTAVLEGDEHKMRDIEDQRFENLFLRHANKGTLSDGEGSLYAQLEAIAGDPELSAEEKELANRYLERFPEMEREYLSIWNKHANDGTVNQVWKAKMRMQHTNDLLGEINEDLDQHKVEVARDIKNTEGQNVSAVDMELITLRTEQQTLNNTREQLMEGGFNPALQRQLKRKSDALDKRINELENVTREDDNVPESVVKAHSKMVEVNKLANDRAKAFTAYHAYKQMYEFADTGKLRDNIRKENKMYVDDLINNAVTTADIDKAILQSSALDLSPRDRKNVDKALDNKANYVYEQEQKQIQQYEDVVERTARLNNLNNRLKNDVRSTIGRLGGLSTQLSSLRKANKALSKKLTKDPSLSEVIANNDAKIQALEYDVENTRNRLRNNKLYQGNIQDSLDKANVEKQELEGTPGFSELEFNAEEFIRKGVDSVETNPDEKMAGANMLQDSAPEVSDNLRTGAVQQRTTDSTIPKSSIIQVADYEESNDEDPIGEFANAQQDSMEYGRPENLAYLSDSDNFKFADHHMAIADWLELETAQNKVGTQFEVVVDKKDLKNKFISGQKDMVSAINKFHEGAELSDAEMEILPIRLYALNTAGERIQYGNKDVYGWLREADEAKYPQGGADYLSGARKKIVEFLREGKKITPKITKIGGGRFKFEKGLINDLRDISGIDNWDGRIMMSDGENMYVNGTTQSPVDKNEISAAGTAGFIYAKVRRPDGSLFPLKLNSRKLNVEESTALATMITHIAKGVSPKEIVSEVPGIAGISYKDAMELLVFEGEASKNGQYPLHLDFKGKQLFLGDDLSNPIPFDQVAGNDARIKQYLRTMWRTTNSDMINKKLTYKFPNDFEWFLGTVDVDMSYNDFQMNDGALNTNAIFPSDRPFVNPYVELSDAATWFEKDVKSDEALSKKAIKLDEATQKVAKKSESQNQNFSKAAPAPVQAPDDVVIDPNLPDFFPEKEVGTKKMTLADFGESEDSGISEETFEEAPDPGPVPGAPQAPVVVPKGLKGANQSADKAKPATPEEINDNQEGEIFVPKKDKTKQPPKTDEFGFNDGEILFSKFEKDAGKVDVNKELEALKTILPYVPAHVHKGLIGIPGGFAEGMFHDSMVTISDAGNKGVAYHEAFHAVSQLYLTPESRAALYEEVRDDYGKNISDTEAEEILAEQFRDYMVKRDKVPSLTKWLYDLILDLVDLFKSDKRKLFSEIRNRRFAYSPKTSSAARLYSRLATPGDFNRDVIQGMTYLAFKYNGTRSQDRDVQGVEEEVFSHVKNRMIDIQAAAIKQGREDIARRYSDVFSNWDAFVALTKTEIEAYDFDFRKDDGDQVEDEENVGGNLNITNALNYSGKQNATKNTKLMVAMLTDAETISDSVVPVESKYFGRSLPKLANFAKSWRLLEQSLPGIVDTETHTAQEQMLEAIKVASKDYPPFRELVQQLESENVPEFKKTQFYTTFSKQNVLYSMSLGTPFKDGVEWKIGNADQQNQASQIRNTWKELFQFDNVTEDGRVVNRDGLQKQLSRFNSMFTKVTVDLGVNDELPTNSYTALADILTKIGLPISTEGVATYVNSMRGTTPTAKMKIALGNIQYVFRPREGVKKAEGHISLKETLVPNYRWDESQNFITSNSILQVLAASEALHSNLPGENMILGPDGKTYWTKSQNNFLTKTISRWKQNPSFIDRVFQNDYHRHSAWLPLIKQMIESGQGEGVNLELFLFNKLEDGSDVGDTFTDISTPDEYIDRINRTLLGSTRKDLMGSVFSPLTMADKSTGYQLGGLPMQKFGIKPGQISKKAISAFYRYAIAEIERISMVSREPGNVKYFKDKGGLQSTWFPELSKDGKVADKLGLYNEDGSTNLISVENDKTAAYTVQGPEGEINQVVNEPGLRSYIQEALESRVRNEYMVLRRQGIIRHYSNGGKEIVGVSESIQRAYGLKDSNPEVVSAGLTELVADYTLNSMIANIEFTMMFSGDPGYYKDLSKRTPATIATGTDLMLMKDIKRKFKVAVIDDFEGESDLYQKYVKEFKKMKLDTSLLTPYKRVNQADAQAYIRPERFKNLMRMLGKWQEAVHGPAFARLMDPNKTVSPEDLLTMQPLKGMHFELRRDPKLRRLIPTYLKYSQAVLWPAMVKGTELENLLSKMEGSTIDEVVFASGIKVGAENISQSKSFTDLELTPFELDNYNWKLQQDLPSKYTEKGKALVGSQVKKNILANLTGRVISFRGEEMSGEDIAALAHRIESKLSDKGREGLNREWQISKEGNIKNPKNIYRKLREKFIRDRVSNNIIEQVTDKILAPFDAIFQFTDKIESELHAKVTKKTVKLDAPGGAFIQMSNAGFSKLQGIKSLSDLKVTDRNGIIHLKDVDQLRGPRKDENGNTLPGDVFIPYNALRSLPKDIREQIDAGELTGSEIKDLLGDTITGIIGYRIPNQGMSSIDSLEIAGILPPSMGDAMITYTEITAKTGSDFDIDKMYVMTPNVEWDEENSRLKKVDSDEETTKGLQNKRLELWDAILRADATFGDLVTPIDSDFLTEDAYYLAFLDELRNNEGDLTPVFEVAGISSVESFLKDSNRKKIAVDYFKNKPLAALEFATPSHQLELKTRNTAGKAGVGQTANHLTHHALAQQAGLYLKYDIGLGNRSMLAKNEKQARETEYGSYRAYADLSQANNEKGTQITQAMSAWLNAYVDNAKDPYISLINNNTKTANTVFMMLRAGVDPEIVNRFMSQPIIKDFVQEQFKKESKNLPPEIRSYQTAKVKKNGELVMADVIGAPLDAFNLTLAKWGLNPSGITLSQKDLSGITTDVLENQILSPDALEQVQYLMKYMTLEFYGRKLNDAVRASKADTQGSFGNAAQNLVARELLRKVEKEGFVGNFDELFNGTQLETYHENSTELSNKIFGKKLLSKTPMVEATVREIFAQQGMDYVTDAKLAKRIMASARSYVYSDSEMLKTSLEEVRNMFYGKKSMARKLKKMKELYPDNVLIEALGFKTVKNGPSFVTMPSSKHKDQAEADKLWIEWERMLTDETEIANGYTMARFAQDLVKYSYYASGFQKNINSFYDLVPGTYMSGTLNEEDTPNFNSFIEGWLEAAQSATPMVSFIDQFYRHNSEDVDLVPIMNIKNVNLVRVGKLYENGFKVAGEEMPSKWNVGNKDSVDHVSPKPYVRLKDSKKNTYLYRYAGYEFGDFYYEAVSPLGLKEAGNVIVEYQTQDALESVVHGKKEGLPLSTLINLSRSQDDSMERHNEPVYDGLGEAIEVSKDSFKFESLDNVTWEIRPEHQDGVTRYAMFSQMGDITRRVGDMGDTKELALKFGEEKLRALGAKRIERALKNMC